MRAIAWTLSTVALLFASGAQAQIVDEGLSGGGREDVPGGVVATSPRREGPPIAFVHPLAYLPGVQPRHSHVDEAVDSAIAEALARLLVDLSQSLFRQTPGWECVNAEQAPSSFPHGAPSFSSELHNPWVWVDFVPEFGGPTRTSSGENLWELELLIMVSKGTKSSGRTKRLIEEPPTDGRQQSLSPSALEQARWWAKARGKTVGEAEIRAIALAEARGRAIGEAFAAALAPFLRDFITNLKEKPCKPTRAWRVDGVYWNGYHLTGVICEGLDKPFTLQAVGHHPNLRGVAGRFTLSPRGETGGTWSFSAAAGHAKFTAASTFTMERTAEGAPVIRMDPGSNWNVTTGRYSGPLGEGRHLGTEVETITLEPVEECPAPPAR